MKLKQKLGVASMFALGFFVIISSSEFPSGSKHAIHSKLTDHAHSRPRLLLSSQ
jgi:hypothetical protein